MNGLSQQQNLGSTSLISESAFEPVSDINSKLVEAESIHVRITGTLHIQCLVSSPDCFLPCITERLPKLAPGASRPALTDRAGVISIQHTNPCCKSTLHTNQVIVPNRDSLTAVITEFSHDSTRENNTILIKKSTQAVG